ncbi:3-hydroxyacyl-CoA dehydrogenase [Pararhodobacter marinus]|uniref:3-hydroxyacyl-CoA dehydrogenase n=1 Tax=Pararhodobacter marinus TaxID=2184063 RepID=A0A2U2CAX2_9RHOB|nr:SDR family NAD(P)-dependent oxidoreductase [Pararhodobacter marinus]PWE28934.1 3-hydroxyacyl-CoA dehydrogenase [Pararhodobacter marinus]
MTGPRMRRVLVTGGGSGIGRAIARAFAEAGDAVTICGRRMDALEETAQGYTMTLRQADVTNEAQVAALFDQPYDVVVANAGGGPAAKLRNTTLEQWNDTLAVTLTGTFLTFRAALDGMGQGGRLIAIASTASLKGGATIAAYASAKHGVLGLVRSVAQEVAKQGITCNAICPGFVDTPLAQGAIEGLMEKKGLDRAKAEAMVASGNPVGGLIRPDEVASAALYLASPGARMINGHALSLSGGEI